MFLEAVRASEVSTRTTYSPISDPELTTQEGSVGGSARVWGPKIEIFSKKFYVPKWSQKAFHIIYATFFTQIRPTSPSLDPILRHVWWHLAVFWLYHAQKTAFFSEKIASQNMQKANHIIKVTWCHFPNHIFTAVHMRFTRILACAACPIIFKMNIQWNSYDVPRFQRHHPDHVRLRPLREHSRTRST